MGTGECGKYQITGIWLTLINMHSCKFLIIRTDFWHIGKIQFWIYAMCIHIHCQSNNVNVTGTLTVSKQSTFDTFGSC